MNSLEVMTFDGPLHMVEEIRQVDSVSEVKRDLANKSFHGCPLDLRTVDDLRGALVKTWREGIALVERTAASLRDVEMPAPVARRRSKVWAEDGDEVCEERLERGQPCWRSTRRKPMPGSKVVTLGVGVAASAMHSPESLAWRTAAAVVLAELLEPAGFACEIVAYRYSGGMYVDGRDSIIVCPVKEASAPIDIGTLVNVLSPWFYRTAFFAAGWIGGQVTEGYGRVNKVSGSGAEKYVAGGSEAYYLDSVWSEQTAIEAVKAILAEASRRQDAA